MKSLFSIAINCCLFFTGQFANAAEFNFIAVGDAPYFGQAGVSMFEKFIDQSNSLNPSFVVHLGDIKDGSTTCTNEHFELVHSLFKRFTMPLIYTPGDNEWTDCHRSKTPPNDPIERLSKIRSMFFSDSKSLGSSPLVMYAQSQDKKYSAMVENRRWVINEVLFFTLHVVGSANNRDPNKPSAMKEYEARNKANLDWLEDNFDLAKKQNLKSVVIFHHADLMANVYTEDMKDHVAETVEGFKLGFKDTVGAISRLSKDFAKPVLTVQGDSHALVMDHPFKIKDGLGVETVVTNATRLQVYGAPDVRGVKVNVDTSKPHLFSYEPLIGIDWEY